MTSILNNLRPNPGSTRDKMRIGRGIGSGKGKTGGRGGKGQTARSGVAIAGFEGGQTPIHRRLPKRGFNNHTRVEFEVVNVSDIQEAIDNKKFKAGAVDIEMLIKAGLVKDRKDGIKLLSKGAISAKIEIAVQKASAAAVKAVEAAGGKVTFVPLNKGAAQPSAEKPKVLRGKKAAATKTKAKKTAK